MHSWLYQSDLVTGLSALFSRTKLLIWSIRQTNISVTHNNVSTIICAKLCAWLSKRFPYAIITNATASKDSHVAFGYDATKIVVISNGVDLRAFAPDRNAGRRVRKELGIRNKDLLIGLVARFNSQKNHALFFEAAKMIFAQLPFAHFLMCGAGMQSDNHELVKISEGSIPISHLHLIGERDDVSDILNALDLFMLSSSGEGWPNVVGEAMACGLPCVVTDVGDTGKIVGDTGYVVQSENACALAVAAIHFLKKPIQQRECISVAARRCVEEKFEIETIAREYKSVYEKAYEQQTGQN